jgi:hypothetical protein
VQTFKNSHHQVLTLNQLVQLLLWLKHGVAVVVDKGVVEVLEILAAVAAVAVHTHLGCLKPLTLAQQKQ